MPMPMQSGIEPQWMPAESSGSFSMSGSGIQVDMLEVQEAIDNLMDDHGTATQDDTAEIKDSLILEPTGYPVEVYIIAHSKSGRNNMCQRIPCKKAKPLGNWCYDLQTDQFLVDCAGFQHLGRFRMGYRLRMEQVEGWSVDIPLPSTSIEKNLSERNRQLFDKFKKKFSEKDHSFSFIQCSGVFNGEE